MPVSKNKRKKKAPGKRAPRVPKLMEKLPCTEESIRRLEQGNDKAVMRLYFGTASSADADFLYTHIAVSWELAARMAECDAIRAELREGARILKQFAAEKRLPREQIDRLQDILKFSMELWRKSTIEEVVRVAQAFKRNDADFLAASGEGIRRLCSLA